MGGKMFFKRLFDIVASFIGIIVFFPLMLLIGIIIKLTSKGPVIFKQKRLTKGMKEFTILKFRSMKVDFDKGAVGIQVKGSSQSITPIGKFIRKTKLDELPQLFNIIMGDMSFIGPRPELPRRLKYYLEEDKRVFLVRSGISSPASIIFSDEEYLMNQVKEPEKFYLEQVMPYKIKLNLYYIKTRSFWSDMFLIVATFLKMINKIEDKSIVKDEQLLLENQEIKKKVGIEY
ncbi:Probable quinovosaminephosphotransferae [Fusobacterium nucleatum subsp. nucleatum ATCC 25586]|uniref:Probable quinovosaminephosphotransferae n=1 Tax=Fusobacterium nucleatum subsp. nucleatum (strain ATCC 25586 / DSM 15643 / BCRC 10681 / CIP 101130 / JCM 8532 / KCTC 2640 / LMG 13131 / VPI 4355) TaxID=190304 RepID=Q8R6F8_FUSNN|nr:Probable quinovosaminephosphotransferae [Fusobacterium nucleatum subsp. nucleatum ATCC 25586]